MKPQFLRLNAGWNAEPNAPEPLIEVQGHDVVLRFYVNPFQFEEFEEDELGFLRFLNCARYRLGATNDEGWYRGHCRFSQVAPEWGEFYEVAGDSTLEGPIDWHVLSEKTANQLHHFLFYLRDHTFECLAEDCMVEPRDDNALHRTRKLIPPFK